MKYKLVTYVVFSYSFHYLFFFLYSIMTSCIFIVIFIVFRSGVMKAVDGGALTIRPHSLHITSLCFSS